MVMHRGGARSPDARQVTIPLQEGHMHHVQRTLTVALVLSAVAPTSSRAQRAGHVPLPPPIEVSARDSVAQAGAARNDSGPSRDETMEFLRSFLESRIDDERGPVAAVEADACVLRILYAKGRDRLLTFDLTDVDPNTIRANVTRQISLQTTAAQSTILWQEIDWAGSTPHLTDELERRSTLDMQLKSHEDQQRVLRALQHGVKVCGGKVAPF